MNPVETHEITELIAKLRTEGGFTVLVIEDDMHVVEGIPTASLLSTTGSRSPRIVRPGGDRPRGRGGIPGPADVHRGGGAAMTDNGAPLLRLDAVNTYYGPIDISRDALAVHPGELVCLLGGNASGSRRP